MKRLITLWIAASVGLALAPGAYGEDAVQTDWSGGTGSLSPVPEWQNAFTAAEGIDWAAPGSLTLLSALPVEHDITTTFGEPAGVGAADFDGDLDLDVVSVAYQGDEVVWWENDGAGGGWIAHTIATAFPGANSLATHDIDHDGDIDVAATAERANRVAWWANDGSGGGWEPHVVDSAVGGPFSVCAADLDGDGDDDLCTAAFAAGWIVWWENMDGAGTSWTRHILDAAFTNAWWAVTADVNADGRTDVIGCSYTLNDVCWWQNDGGGAWTKRTIDEAIMRPLSVRAADMDGDSDTDVLGVSDRGRIAWWENDGAAGGWLKHTVDAQLNQPFSSRVADLDDDGDQDVISNERLGDRVMWYENVTGGGLVWLEHAVDVTCDGPNDVLAADLNGDQELDIVATHSWDNSVIWYESTSDFCPAGTLDSSILDTGEAGTYWGQLACVGVMPVATSIGLEVRASSDSTNLGAWIPVPSPCEDLSAYIPDETRYFQYRILLGTTDVLVTPGVEEIHLAWSHSSAVEGEGTTADPGLSCLALPNPSLSNPVTLRFTIPRAGRVALVLYDAAGRKVRTLAGGTFPEGEHSVACGGLASGVYLYRLSAGESTRAGKITVQ